MKNNIAYYRTIRGITQAELAKRLGYTAPAGLSKLENGIIDPPYSKIMQIGEILDVSPDALMDVKKPKVSSGEEDLEILEAFHSSSANIQEGIKSILGVKKE